MFDTSAKDKNQLFNKFENEPCSKPPPELKFFFQVQWNDEVKMLYKDKNFAILVFFTEFRILSSDPHLTPKWVHYTFK